MKGWVYFLYGHPVESIGLESSIQCVPVCPDHAALGFQTNIVQTVINSLSVFKDFGQHSRWIPPDNIDYYKSRRMVIAFQNHHLVPLSIFNFSQPIRVQL